MHRRADLHRRLPINTRRTLVADGNPVEEPQVACPRHAAMVPLDRCTECGQCDGLVFDGRPGHSYIICRQVPTPGELAAEGRYDVEGRAEQPTVADVMTRNVTCVRAELSLESARELVLERGFGGAPVVDADGRPIGVVTKTDLLRERWESSPGDGTEKRVGEVMTPIVLALPETAPIAEAAAMMAYEHVHAVPIVCEAGRVVGIVSSIDLLRWIAGENGFLIPPKADRRAIPW